MRINDSLGKASDALDDITDTNLANLEAVGQQWSNDKNSNIRVLPHLIFLDIPLT
ncbi:MAG: hypothetical protein ACK5Z5_04095 [Neisseriaceae bacterium]